MKHDHFVVMLLGAFLLLPSCGSDFYFSEEVTSPPEVGDEEAAQDEGEVEPDEAGASQVDCKPRRGCSRATESETEERRAGAVRHPKIFLHGGGPEFIVNMASAAAWFRADGFADSELILMRYPVAGDLADIRAALLPQLEAAFAAFPEDTRFDVIGHSLGHFAAIDAMAATKRPEKFRKLIGIAGVAHGQTKPKPVTCMLPNACGDVYDLLTEKGHVGLENFYRVNADALGSWEKCSLYSPDDGMLGPVDSGAFPDGTNKSLPGIRHLKFKSDPRVYAAIKEHCYGGELD